METLSGDIVAFLRAQSYVVVSSVGEDGAIHNACKGILRVDPPGRLFLLDVFVGRTFANLRRDPRISITAVDEHHFRGYSLSGTARLLSGEDLTPELLRVWEDALTERLTKRVLKNLSGTRGHPRHPELLLPKPKYLIEMTVGSVVDLTPPHMK